MYQPVGHTYKAIRHPVYNSMQLAASVGKVLFCVW